MHPDQLTGEIDLVEDSRTMPRAVTLQIWHVAILLVVQIAVLAVGYGRLAQKMDDTERRVASIESDKRIGRDEFYGWTEALERRLDRIESALLELSVGASARARNEK